MDRHAANYIDPADAESALVTALGRDRAKPRKQRDGDGPKCNIKDCNNTVSMAGKRVADKHRSEWAKTHDGKGPEILYCDPAGEWHSKNTEAMSVMKKLLIQFVMRATNADKREMAEGEGAVRIAELLARRIMLESRLESYIHLCVFNPSGERYLSC